jgi:hypothetical protein
MMEALWSEVERGIAEEFGVAPLTDEYPLGEPQETLP